MRWAIAIGGTVVAAALVIVMLKGFGRDPHEVPFNLKGKPAPEFTLKRLDNGARVTLAELKGKPLVINFWATWCGPCKQEDPVLRWGYRKFGQEAAFIGVIFEDTEENARRALAENNLGFPQLVDPLSSMAVDYGVTGVPETYFVDASGTIRGKFVGPIDPQSLTERIQELSRPAPMEARN
jgi:cytochrome c biogenesis protein CcmG/thiol:disulfide interchange protein DsbE